ncbi:hypothetical protein [Pectobacterium carotovorum]|uniref:hypothetical protein n=1 Tax=Pectobacterium carotovorum TaxID=554 RepID=UPI0001A4326B|nr:hypothetical protein [Pectobacterium carotovorum]KFX02303.1 hypothetical protein JV33_04055 [Pectobacterium carotovorum subsp. carotovorum]KML72160.1 hypothetical protein G032_03570 [Pectobacterium carotovorum subsp. carotovorum ICMP 5702]MBA0177173.1 hypothetical protein [Pectobacterium carotovorum]MDK9421738.1 hypothetical protein [Pectobacterium carotovorum]QHP55587.1 hypothetical protein EH203_18170 [Pectobacterium carotovorum subsp. carotovorum]
MSSINENLPVLNITKQKLTLSKDEATVLWCGVEYPVVNFVNVVVPNLLAYFQPNSHGSHHLLSEMSVNGFSIRGYGKHATAWAETIRNNREAHEQRLKEVREHQERMAAMNATPAEIAAERAEKARIQDEYARRYGRKGADFGL